ncbi:EAL domain-containing protein [Virgibacillus sp. MSP4-1]|uniref:putative bifunctional diguanylate cyclase/phosphodiesterase n=1 Tax=Virgibacillus sp. MSP4-1 TaxID=2700081 RepID=UPI0003A69FBD|nr:EAL domain-containing protein [Virgibacillus sp. MSP4-1]QHS21922.1 EAL domain-containing protein [Virgibacillus sp. MSP4-1]
MSPIQYISEQKKDSAKACHKMAEDLYHAIQTNELQLVFQPILDQQKQVVTVEALLRWKHPGISSPEQIIQLAEAHGLMSSLGEWILSQACLHVKRLQENGLPDLNLNVNISPSQFSDYQFVSKVSRILSRTGLEPEKLELEITENLNMLENSNITHQLTQLTQLGIGIAVDDYGTGYSSLHYIYKFPINRIKIDKSFVMNLQPNDQRGKIILKSIIDLASDLGLEVVAEGVETEKQYQFLKSESCHLFQGYYFYKPLSIEDFLELAGSFNEDLAQEEYNG